MSDTLETKISVDQILNPISLNTPCGVNVRQASGEAWELYNQLKDARNTQRKEEKNSIEQEEKLTVNPKGWKKVFQLSQKLLIEHTKDIEVLSWFLEALARINSFQGMVDGFGIFEEMLKKFGSNMYPSKDEDDDDASQKLLSISVLSGKYEIGTLVTPIYYNTIIPLRSKDNINSWSIREALKKTNKTTKDTSVETLVKLDLIKSALVQINKNSFDIILRDSSKCLSAFKKFTLELSNVFAMNAPNLSSLAESLEYCCGLVNSIKSLVDKKNTEIEDDKKNTDIEENKEKVETVITKEKTKTIQNNLSIQNLTYKDINRESAVKILGVLSEFFKFSQPHSPISYSIDRIKNWAQSSLEEIMKDILEDEMVRDNYSKITGVPFLTSKQTNSNYNNDY